PGQTVYRAEPSVVGDEKITAEPARETGALRLQHVPIDGVGQEIAGYVDVVKRLRECAALVDNSAAGDVAAFEAVVRDMVEVAEGVRILQLPMLAEVLDVIAALDLVKHGNAAEIGAGDGVAVPVEVESPGVAAALGE